MLKRKEPTKAKDNRPLAADLEAARRTLSIEAEALKQLEAALDGSFSAAVGCLAETSGRVIVTGIGKSGHVGRKIAATLASTGTPAQFVHAAEANHGDLGMITEKDAVLALSWSGEAAELLNLVDYARRFSIPLVAMTSEAESSLAKAANLVLVLPKAEEACPNGLAPTTSTTLQIALGDALAIALLERRGFTAHDFRDFHPGGKLGAKLRTAADLMRSGGDMMLVGEKTPMSEVIVEMTAKSLGAAGVSDGSGRLVGVIVDGDLRRHMAPDLLNQRAEDVMTRDPKTIAPETLVSEALSLMAGKITSLFVVDEESKPLGLLHIHDILRAGAV